VPDDDEPDQDAVIDLASLGFMPDIGEMARNRISSAQQRLGLTIEEFAAELNRMVDWEVLPEAVRSWSTQTTPPGDILIAADLLVQHGSRRLDDESVGTAGADVVQELVAERFADLAGVYPSRASFSSALPPHALFDGAHDVSVAGLSLNLVCQQYPEQRLRQLVEGGCVMRCLFLVPYGSSVQSREHEEDYPPGHLSMLTEMNMHILTKFRGRLSDDAQARLRIRTYDEPIRFNLVLIDRRLAVVQPYMPAVRGVDSPTFLLRRLPSGSGLMPAFESVFTWLWERGKRVD
jgi:hypothetical protein